MSSLHQNLRVQFFAQEKINTFFLFCPFQRFVLRSSSITLLSQRDKSCFFVLFFMGSCMDYGSNYGPDEEEEARSDYCIAKANLHRYDAASTLVSEGDDSKSDL